jgi:hypothetical protein
MRASKGECRAAYVERTGKTKQWWLDADGLAAHPAQVLPAKPTNRLTRWRCFASIDIAVEVQGEGLSV